MKMKEKRKYRERMNKGIKDKVNDYIDKRYKCCSEYLNII
jgi:hypothetical protein